MTISTSKKTPGPIRWNAIIPVTIIIIVMAIYGKFFFDAHCKSALQWIVGKTHGAEVNIAQIKTSLFAGSFRLDSMQITDKENPINNLLEIGQIRFKFSWDALLRAKFVIEDAAIENIQANTKRLVAGEVYPDKPSEQDQQEKNENIEKVKGLALNQAQEEFSQNALGDIASIIGGANKKDQVKLILSELKSEKRIQEIEQDIKLKEVQWKQTIDQLPKSDDFKDISRRSKEINLKEKNPLKLLKEIKKMKMLVDEAKNKAKLFKLASSKLKEDLTTYASITKEIDDLIKQDMSTLQKRMKVPSINFKDFAVKVFGKMFAEKAAGLKKYVDMAAEYMPEKKSETEIKAAKAAQPKARRRGEGKIYQFPVTTGYPLFWLKKATISSQASAENPMSGNITGAITNISSDPIYIGKPGLIFFKGGFPNQNIHGVEGKIEINHHLKNMPNNETFSMKIRSYPIAGKTLSKSTSLTMGINKATGSLLSSGKLEDGKVQLSLKNNFNKIDYLIAAKNKDVKEIFTNVLADTPNIYVHAAATGSWGNLGWSIKSNLADDLSKGLKHQVNARIAKEKEQIKKKLDERIGPKKKALEAKISQAKEKIENLLAKNKQKIDREKNKIDAKLTAAKKKNRPQQKAKDKLKKAFKKFKFKL